MKLINYISPKLVFNSLMRSITDLEHYRTYKKAITELNNEGKLVRIGIKLEGDKMFIGVNLNPELLIYTDDSKESVELKFVSEEMRKYTDFLEKEMLLDSVKADYDRVQTEDFYGYIVQLSYDFKGYKKSKLQYDIGYIVTTASAVGIAIYTAIQNFL